MRINTNVSALQAARNLGNVNKAVASSTEKLSSGFRINKASDDAAGLGIANVLRSDIRAYNQASRNAEQANSVYNIAEGAASAIQNMLERMKELAAQSASDSVDSDARGRIGQEFAALQDEIDRTVKTTKFQGQLLLDGNFGAKATPADATNINSIKMNGTAAATYTLDVDGVAKTATITSSADASITQTLDYDPASAAVLDFNAFGLTIDAKIGLADTTIAVARDKGVFLIGASGSYAQDDTISINGADLDLQLSTLNVAKASVTVDTRDNAADALDSIDTAIKAVNTTLGVIGAGQSRVDNAISNLKTTVQNYSAAESVIRDVDMAEEMTKFSKNQILSQAGVAMLAQANQAGQGVLRLLQG